MLPDLRVNDRYQLLIERNQLWIRLFVGASTQMDRDSHSATFELTVMEESETRRQSDDRSRGSVLRIAKLRGDAGLVVVLKESSHARLVLSRCSQ